MKPVRTSLEVGFADGALPERFARYRGRQARALAAAASFPYEDEQFDVVMMDGASVDVARIREAHRVLRPDGRLFFTVQERTKKQDGFTLPDVYSIVRCGFDIVGVERPAWWLFGRRGRTITISAAKKAWKTLTNTYRPYA